jgi:hypothetical protein
MTTASAPAAAIMAMPSLRFIAFHPSGWWWPIRRPCFSACQSSGDRFHQFASEPGQ